MEQSNIYSRKIEIEFDLKERVIHQLILRSGFEKSLGLLNGKMGIIIFFFTYGKHTNKKIYGEIAENLLDEVWDEITLSTPIGFDNGLTGIGWAIEYLIQNHFVDGNSSEVCAEIDRIIEMSFNATIHEDASQADILRHQMMIINVILLPVMFL